MIGTDRWRSEPPCVYPPAKAGHMAKRRVGVEYSVTHRQCWSPCAQGRCHPTGRCCESTVLNHRAINATIQLSFRTVFVAFIARWLTQLSLRTVFVAFISRWLSTALAQKSCRRPWNHHTGLITNRDANP